jgi:AcrR family transcriptional regulator
VSRRVSCGQAGNSVVQKGRKSTQRERLLAGIVSSANREGYAGASVSRIIAEAGVSRPTFYEYFADKDDCFLAALAEIHRRLLEDVRRAVNAGPPQQAMRSGLAAIVRAASAEPAQALFLMSEAMAAGPRALDARDKAIAEIERVIERAQRQLPPETLAPDVSPRIVLGGLYRLLASRLRRGEPDLSRALEDLSAWVESYGHPAGEHRWQTLAPSRARPARAGLAPGPPAPGPLAPPAPLPPGRPSPSREVVAVNHRERILHAAAQLAEEKGYNATTIADITRLAGIDGRAFYAIFADKQDAFMAVHELGVQQVMSATAGAFFTGASWPERIWEAGQALTGFLESNPLIAHVGFVEAYAVGPGAVQRVEDSHFTFTIFLEEGYQHEPRGAPPPHLALEAIVTCIFEIVYLQARAKKSLRVTGMLGHMGFIALAPFLGAGAANRLIDRWLDVPE